MEWNREMYEGKSADDIKKSLSEMTKIPCPEYDGIIWPSYKVFIDKGVEQALKDIKMFDMRKSDILICAYMKSGTHWIFEIINMLLKDTAQLQKEIKTSTMLEMVSDLQTLDDILPQRVLNTHLHFQYLPQMQIENRYKIIHVLRNPKDVLISKYYHCKQAISLNMNIPWEDFFEAWMSSTDTIGVVTALILLLVYVFTVAYGSWYDYELEMEQSAKEYPDLIFTCFYEDIKKNPVKEIRKLAAFLGLKFTDELIEKIAEATSIENMKKNKFDVSSIIYGKGFIYRKGEIGDWRNHFTVAQNERFDAQFAEKMKDSEYTFQFE